MDVVDDGAAAMYLVCWRSTPLYKIWIGKLQKAQFWMILEIVYIVSAQTQTADNGMVQGHEQGFN